MQALLRKISRLRLYPRPPLPDGETQEQTEELVRMRKLARQTGEQLERESAISSALAALYEPLISPDSTIETMASAVLEQALALTGSCCGYVSSVDPVTGDHIVQAATWLASAATGTETDRASVRIGKARRGTYTGLRGHSLNTGEAFLTNSPREHPACNGFPPGHVEIKRFLSVPVILQGKPAGQISLANAPADYTQRDLVAVQRLAGLYALALERKQSQQRAEEALREKEVMLREIHHRVKNNLQVISSLLSLQAGRLRDPEALEMLKESQNRVRSMALVHEQLHRSRDLSRIHFGEYVRNLTASLFCSYGIDSSTIALRLRIAEAFFTIDTAVPCGLIIQELVSNALKHAFPNGRTGEITISLAALPGGRWRLGVADNGAGIPPQVDVRGGASLGLRLVKILADQLEARVACVSDGGTRFEITFRETNSKDDSEENNEQTKDSGS